MPLFTIIRLRKTYKQNATIIMAIIVIKSCLKTLQNMLGHNRFQIQTLTNPKHQKTSQHPYGLHDQQRLG